MTKYGMSLRKSPQSTKSRCRKRIESSTSIRKKFGHLITADHKVLSEDCESRNNHWKAVVVQDLATQWLQSYPCKSKSSQETEKSSRKILQPTGEPKVIYTDNSLEFGKACEELFWNHCASAPHRFETNGISVVAIRLGGKWWADSMKRYCHLRNVQNLLCENIVWKAIWRTM